MSRLETIAKHTANWLKCVACGSDALVNYKGAFLCGECFKLATSKDSLNNG